LGGGVQVSHPRTLQGTETSRGGEHASPLEQVITGVENGIYMSSQATTDGVMTLTVTFKLGTDLDKAQVQVQTASPKRYRNCPPRCNDLASRLSRVHRI
jgi:hypothetical protein